MWQVMDDYATVFTTDKSRGVSRPAMTMGNDDETADVTVADVGAAVEVASTDRGGGGGNHSACVYSGGSSSLHYRSVCLSVCLSIYQLIS